MMRTEATTPGTDARFFPREDGSRIPYKVFSSKEIYDREQALIYAARPGAFSASRPKSPSRAITSRLSSATRWW